MDNLLLNFNSIKSAYQAHLDLSLEDQWLQLFTIR